MQYESLRKSYFRAHQVHYEQMGYLKGTLSIDNEKRYLEMEAFRDHSFGRYVLKISFKRNLHLSRVQIRLPSTDKNV